MGNRIFLISVASSFLLLTACSQAVQMTSSDGIFQSPNFLGDNCTGAVLKNQYIVKWKNGAVTKEFGRGDEAFKKEFIENYKNEIELAEPDFKVSIPEHIDALMNVQKVTQADNWGVIKVAADQVWKQGQYGQGVIVAVVDTGIDAAHPQLASQVALNPGENGTDSQGRDKSKNGVDDDGNGFIDDYYGWNFVAQTNAPVDDNGHGTHVSGIIAAQHADSVAKSAPYVQGLAPKAKILPLKFLDGDGSGALSDAVSAIDYAVARGARVINASWGGTACSATLQSRIQGLINRNILFVAASGNDSVDLAQNPRYPASFYFLSQLTVGATGMFDSMAEYSNYGTSAVQLFAPGTLIISTFPGGAMAALSGTSMATPFVSGAAALFYGSQPTATLMQSRAAILGSVTKNPQYHNQTQGLLHLSTLLSN
jgi:subtilisin family serine protease